MFSAFNPSKWSSGQPTLRRPGSSWGFGALLKGLTSVVDTSCQSHDSNPQPWVTSPTLYPLGHDCPYSLSMRVCERSQRLLALCYVPPDGKSRGRRSNIIRNKPGQKKTGSQIKVQTEKCIYYNMGQRKPTQNYLSQKKSTSKQSKATIHSG